MYDWNGRTVQKVDNQGQEVDCGRSYVVGNNLYKKKINKEGKKSFTNIECEEKYAGCEV